MEIEEAQAAALAKIPEHSLPLMTAMSRGAPLRVGDYLFFGAPGSLIAIGYPLTGKYDSRAFYAALETASETANAASFFAIAPEMPPELAPHTAEADRYYVLSAHAPVPPKLRGPIARARQRLELVQNRQFTPAHRELWAEFLRGRAMPARVRELYARVPAALAANAGNLLLLDAMTAEGNLAASLLLDFAPDNFATYVIGAHSRKNYVAHATDMLFADMLAIARRSGKRFIHLGLGVNDGIRRFKLKWGAKPGLNYHMAQWQTSPAPAQDEPSLALVFRRSLAGGLSKRQILAQLPSQKPFAMLWQVSKNGRISWLGGTAHFFCHSFADAFRKLFAEVDNVIFEGPLDAGFMGAVEEAGKNPPAGTRTLLGLLTEAELARLERVITGPRGFWARHLGVASGVSIDLGQLLRAAPWYAFFTAWTTFLERLGWKESVDLEAWRVAGEMGKRVVGLENLQEQLESLNSLPLERVLRFFRGCHSWKRRAAQNSSAYLNGDLEKMMGSSAEFPTRTEHIVSRRDQRFLERMLPWIEPGGAAVFVGSAHLVNLRHLLAREGYAVRQRPFGVWPRIHLAWRGLTRPDAGVRW